MSFKTLQTVLLPRVGWKNSSSKFRAKVPYVIFRTARGMMGLEFLPQLKFTDVEYFELQMRGKRDFCPAFHLHKKAKAVANCTVHLFSCGHSAHTVGAM